MLQLTAGPSSKSHDGDQITDKAGNDANTSHEKMVPSNPRLAATDHAAAWENDDQDYFY